MKLKEVIESELGLNYMELVRNGDRPSEIANEEMYYQCNHCDEYIRCEDMAVTSGQIGHDVCEDCIDKDETAIEFLKENS